MARMYPKTIHRKITIKICAWILFYVIYIILSIITKIKICFYL